ncbi:MAG: pyruvate dehydrogenase (acetyl-transferring), homodimeric type [Bacteroidetes bacterium]|nr:pyruvate dehydrogenase (acetyl-transferring), homodimeric type [Bacteroidota bacterium]
MKQIENREWIASLQYLLENESPERVNEILKLLHQTAQSYNVSSSYQEIITDYVNTIAVKDEIAYPGDETLEQEIENAIRWNAMATVVKANKKISGLGGHISTYASIATLFEVGFNHFFKGYDNKEPDLIYFQGHASPGIYARSFLEGRFNETNLKRFRREATYNDALSSYPHARLMPDYWQFPTVSMGFTSLQAIYEARFLKYLENRGLKAKNDQKVWAYMGDGEMDEPESLGAITLASREHLDNLIFVVNCNLQRLDGPVRGNGKIIDELEGIFKGAGWNVIKVVWGRNWDPIFKADANGLLTNRLNTAVDGTIQRLAVAKSGDFKKILAAGKDDLAQFLNQFSDQEMSGLTWGGHDRLKVYNAYHQAINAKDKPTVILAQTIKGYGMGSAGEASNEAHQQKKLNTDQLKYYRDKFAIPIKDDQINEIPFYTLDKNGKAYQYLMDRRSKLEGFIPSRKNLAPEFKMPKQDVFEIFDEGSKGREVTTTLAFVQLLSKMLRDKNIKDKVIPIIPDESRTFGMDVLFGQVGIYASHGQKYEPIDKGNMLFYKESRKGVILEEGITEAGCMASLIAAGNNHTSNPHYTIPFFVFYSMFGFQRVGDLVWAAADARAKGFMIGGIAGKTTLSGEGLQHLDGYSHLNVLAFPSVMAYDPAFAYELSVIIQDGIKRMYADDEDLIYYITMLNQSYIMPAKPKNVDQGILNGIYKFKASEKDVGKNRKVELLAGGAIMYEVIEVAEILENEFDVAVDIFSVTSFKCLYEDARDVERDRLQNNTIKDCLINKVLSNDAALTLAASDYIKAVPMTIAPWVKNDFIAMGADGFGLSDAVPYLRDHFELSAKFIVRATVNHLIQKGVLDQSASEKLNNKFKFDSEKANPAHFN